MVLPSGVNLGQRLKPNRKKSGFSVRLESLVWDFQLRRVEDHFSDAMRHLQ